MKKVILSLAVIVSLLVVSCKESTQDKVEDATEAVGTEVQATANDAVETVDSTATEVATDVKEGAEAAANKVEETAKEVKEEVKK
jgi:uncharacterized protein YcfL